MSDAEIFAIVRDVRKLPPAHLKLVRATIDYSLWCVAKERGEPVENDRPKGGA